MAKKSSPAAIWEKITSTLESAWRVGIDRGREGIAGLQAHNLRAHIERLGHESHRQADTDSQRGFRDHPHDELPADGIVECAATAERARR